MEDKKECNYNCIAKNSSGICCAIKCNGAITSFGLSKEVTDEIRKIRYSMFCEIFKN